MSKCPPPEAPSPALPIKCNQLLRGWDDVVPITQQYPYFPSGYRL